jgi:hypothetical protein
MKYLLLNRAERAELMSALEAMPEFLADASHRAEIAAWRGRP